MERTDTHDNDTFDFTAFNAVWQRVQSQQNESPGQLTPASHKSRDEAMILRDFMDDEAQDTQFYRVLALSCSGNMRRQLERISWDERCHLQKLRARYFLLTGETYAPPMSCPLHFPIRDALRQRFFDENKGATAYSAEAEKTPDKALRATYLAHAEDERRHGRIIGCLIDTLFY